MKIIQLSDQLVSEFCGTIEYNWSPPAKYRDELLAFFKVVESLELLPFQERKRQLIKIANAKLDLNEQVYKHLIDATALSGILFHYHDKVELLESVDPNFGKAL